MRSLPPFSSVSGSVSACTRALLTQVRHLCLNTTKMTEPTAPDCTAVPDPAVVVDPMVVNGRCEQADSLQLQQQQQPVTENHGEGFAMDQEMKITESIDDRGRRSELCLKFRRVPRDQDAHRAQYHVDQCILYWTYSINSTIAHSEISTFCFQVFHTGHELCMISEGKGCFS